MQGGDLAMWWWIGGAVVVALIIFVCWIAWKLIHTPIVDDVLAGFISLLMMKRMNLKTLRATSEPRQTEEKTKTY